MQDDPQSIWQNQVSENQKRGDMKISTEYFRLKAEQLRATSKQVQMAQYLAFGALVIASGLGFFRLSNPTVRVGMILLAAGSVGAAWRQRARRASSSTAPVPGLEAYRRELQRWRDHAADLWVLAPLVPGAVVAALPLIASVSQQVAANPAVIIKITPFCVLLVVWFLIFVPGRRRRLRNIDRELEELERLN